MKKLLTISLIIFLGLKLNAQEYIVPYTVWFNYETKLSIKVTYTVKKPFVKILRKGYFRASKGSLHPNQYKGSGYDKGHLYPANKAKTKKQMYNSFDMKNVLPMHLSLNRGIWSSLEEYVEVLAVTNDSVCVETGYLEIEKYVNYLPIPKYLYKILHIYKRGNVRVETYLFRNNKPEYSDYKRYLLK